MKAILLILFIISFSIPRSALSQESKSNKSFKVSIAEHGLHCPNLGPKLKVNIKQIGGEITYFNTETSIMLVNIPAKDLEKANKDYLETIIQLTGYPDNLIKIQELTSTQAIQFLENTTVDGK
jgi:hypothetical protein